jgi:hypothetical protein
MWKNIKAIHSIFKKKLQSKNFNQVNILKVKSTKIILEKTKEKKIRKVEKKSNFEKKLKKNEKKGKS